jgi:hypothetical protein
MALNILWIIGASLLGFSIAAMIHGRETTGQVPPHYEHSQIANTTI